MGAMRGCLILALVVHYVHGHVRFVCPRPRSPRTDLTEQLNGACGLGTPEDSHSEDVAVVSPGLYTVRFEETHIHTDSPFHISLHSYDNTTLWCSLLNHIPHNNLAKVTSPACKENSYPIGHCSMSTYYVTVKIPDITCERCYLKLSFFTMDSTPHSRLPCQHPNGTCKTYVSCANIRIQSSRIAQANGLETCSNYSDNLLGKWPFTQEQIFQARLSSTSQATLKFDYYDMSLYYSIPTKSLGQIMSLELYTSDESDAALRKSISVGENSGGVVQGKWVKPTIAIPQLIAGKFFIEVVTTEKTYKSQLKYMKDMYQPNVYLPHYGSYSKQGWLNGVEFVGQDSTYSAGIQPVGECAPQPYYYISSMLPKADNLHRNFSDHPPHGVLSAAFIDNRVHITALFHGLSKQAVSVTLQGPVLAGAKSMTIPLQTVEGTKRIFATLDASDAVPYAGSTMFLKKVIVKSESGITELTGDLEEGIRAVITGPAGFYGNAVFQFLKGGSLHYSIILGLGRSDIVKSITLNGPARVGTVGPEILSLTDYFLQDIHDYTWFANGTIQDQLSSKMLLHLWQGHLYMDVKLEGDEDNARLISGQISIPGNWYCESAHPAFCPHMKLYLHGVQPDPGIEHVPTSAEAVFYVDRANALQYSIQVKFSNPREIALSAAVTEGLNNPLTISKFKSYSLNDNQHIHEVNGHLPQISPDMETLLTEGRLKLVLSTSVYPDGDILGNIPKMERPHCISKSRFHVSWDLESTPLDGLNVVVNDVVLFEYGGNETVYQVKDRTRYRACDFSEAMLIGSPLHGTDNGQVQRTMFTPGEFYYASKLNCNNSLFMTITVTGNDTRPFSDCSKSVYQVWLDEKLDGKGGCAAVGAIIGASFLAVLSLLLIILLDRRRRFQSKSTTGFQRF